MISNVAVAEGRAKVQGSQLEHQHSLDKAEGYGWEVTNGILQTTKHSLYV